MLDGFPRTLAQAEALDNILKNQTKSIDHAILVDVPDEELVARLSGRRTCRSSECGAMFHVMFNPPKEAGKCDKCGSDLYQRDDDTEATIRERLAVYNKQTAPLIDYYDNKGLLRRVKGVGPIQEIFAAIEKVL
jgi:adenylate kinase